MKNIVILQKDEDGNIYCQELSLLGKEYIEVTMDEDEFWSECGTIVIEELDEILNKEI